MSTYVQLLCHIVFATKDRARVLDAARREDLFRYIWGITKNLDSVLYRIGGVEDHLHILVSLHPTVPVSHYVKTVKVASSKWIKEDRIFRCFRPGRKDMALSPHRWPKKTRSSNTSKTKRNTIARKRSSKSTAIFSRKPA